MVGGMKKKKERIEEAGEFVVQESALVEKPVGGVALKDLFVGVEEIRAGLPLAYFDRVQRRLGIGMAELAEVVGIPMRTLQRRREEGRLSKEESDRLDRLENLMDRAEEVFGSGEAMRQWFTRPQLGLGGLRPLDLADTSAGSRELLNLLGRIDYGVYA